MNMKVVLSFVIAVPLALAFTANAQQSSDPMEISPDFQALRPPPGEPIELDKAFQVLDVNGDGRIDAAEWRERKMALFYLLDDNRDLYLSRNELPRVGRDVFDAADTDGDGQLSGYEFNQAEFVEFTTADPDEDGYITLVQFKAYVDGLEAP